MAPNLVKGDFWPEEISSVWGQHDVHSTVESTSHLLLHCHCSWYFWSRVIQRYGVSPRIS
ncbi:hypothetical protein NC651_016374 [Populus alba x Populus x berolinensis]|nr:hypothetical protein NC651_016374 [Populus alba x Populus x berolinensis]